MRWALVGLLVGTVLSALFLQFWHALVLFVALFVYHKKRRVVNSMTATPDEMAKAKMVPLKQGVLAGIRVLGEQKEIDRR